MLSRSTLLHLRIPFSLLLMPVFLFALGVVGIESWSAVAGAYIAIHLFLYPASNGYNSYFDKDEESIGGLEKPPPVQKELFWAALVFDALALFIAALIDLPFAIALLVYGLVSKAYSHPSIRLKRYPIAGWLVVGIFQGFFMFMAIILATHTQVSVAALWHWEWIFPAILSSAMLMGSYPMTQIYQHEEDGRRGDRTLSRMLGIKGTFIFTGLFFGVAMAGFATYFLHFHSLNMVLIFFTFLSPVLLYFLYWGLKVWKDERFADFKHAMRLNLVSALCLNLFFLLMIFTKL